MSETEQFVIDQLEIHQRMNRFDLMSAKGSPLERKTSFYVLRDMEDKGLITSRLEAGHSSHRWYRVKGKEDEL
jgi:hypothetical protein